MKKDAESEEDHHPHIRIDGGSDGTGAGGDDDQKRKKTGKKGSTTTAATSNKNCQAEKCTADLTDAKAYHRRHKVCEHHAKAQIVVVAGIRQRFCQQCSRFHELSEFDESKRSCRRRLAGHNERRRKNPMDNSQPAGGDGAMKSKSGSNGGGQSKDLGCGSSMDDHRSRSSIPMENANYTKHYHVR